MHGKSRVAQVVEHPLKFECPMISHIQDDFQVLDHPICTRSAWTRLRIRSWQSEDQTCGNM